MKYEEEKHPRDQDGKFTDGNGGVSEYRQNAGYNEILKDDNAKRAKLAKKYSSTPDKDLTNMGLTKGVKPFKIDIQFFATDYSKQSNKSLSSSLKNHKKQIEGHRYKIENPESFYREWNQMQSKEKEGRLTQWQKEINNFENQIIKINAEIEKRRKNNGN